MRFFPGHLLIYLSIFSFLVSVNRFVKKFNKMDSGRVGACHRLENKRRQFLIVVNDVEKNRFETFSDIVKKDKAVCDHKYEKSKMFVRRALVRQRVLQQCMKMRRINIDRNPHQTMYGRYGGRSIEQFGREIETFIAMNHPKIRRQRKIKQLMEEGIEQGKILEEKTISKRMHSFLQRSVTKMRLQRLQKEKSQMEKSQLSLKRLKRESSQLSMKRLQENPNASAKKEFLRSSRPQYGLPKLPVLTNPFFTSRGQAADSDSEKIINVEIKPSEPRKSKEINILKITEDMQNMKVGDSVTVNQTDDQQIKQLKAEGLLRELGQLKTEKLDTGPRPQLIVLPPIKPVKALIQH